MYPFTPSEANDSRLSTSFDPRDNALNFVRLVLASAVIVTHAAPLGGYPFPGALGFISGPVAVDGFFAISGFLITRSWARGAGWVRYLWHRALRIFPAFWVCLAITAFAIAALGTWRSQGTLSGFWFAPDGAFAYLRNHFFLLDTGGYAIAGGPTDVPFPLAWNGSIWTLYWEFLCYLGLGFLGAVGMVKGRRSLLLGVFLSVWVVTLFRAFAPELGAALFDTVQAQSIVRFSFMFLAGAVLYSYAEHVPMRAWMALLALAVHVVSYYLLSLPYYLATGGFAWAYLLLWLGARLRTRVGARTDVSYGMYIYAFPVQQLLVILGLSGFGWLAFAATSVLATLPLAFFSWFVIERTALRLKNWTPGVRGIPLDMGTPPAAQGNLEAKVVPDLQGDVTKTAPRPSVRRLVRVAGMPVMALLFALYLFLMLRGWLLA